MPENDIQKLFFQKVQEKLTERQNLSDILADLLCVSKDSAYRRIRGSTEISLNEATRIAQHFGIAIDEVMGEQKNSALFTKGPFIRNLDDYRAYMQRTIQQLEVIKSKPNHLMYYQAKDIPVYYQFGFPKVASFKIYVWLKSVYNIQKIEGKNFDLKSIPPDLLELAQKQWELFSQINTVEFWNDTTILSILKQLEYYYEAGLMHSKEQAIGVCDEFQKMMKLIYKQSLASQKIHAINHDEFSKASYSMYYHELLLMDNHILVEQNDQELYYFVPYAGVNFLSTSDPVLTQDLRKYMQEQTKKSSLISDISEKERNKFFIRIKNQIDKLRQKIESTDPFM